MNPNVQIIKWLEADELRIRALDEAASIGLDDWCLAAGFVRNMVWDKTHNYSVSTPLNDIDVIYFNPNDLNEKTDKEYERLLTSKSNLPWSVKNQARMHIRNSDRPYTSTCDAMSYWVEIETAIGVRKLPSQSLELVAPFGCESLFRNTVTINNKRRKPKEFEQRVESKGWLNCWPQLTVKYT